MQISSYYTGENSAAKFPELDNLERASQRSRELAIKGEELKLDKKLKDKATFMQMMKTDPVTALAQKNTIEQAKLLNEYNSKWAERYKASNGELSMADQLEMQMDKSNLEAYQKKALSDQKRFEEAEAIISRDTRGYYDKNAYEAVKMKYLEKGELPPNILKIAPQDFGIALSKAAVTGTPSTYIEDVVDEKGANTGYKQEYETRMSQQEAEQFIPQYALTNDAYMEDIMRKFQNLPESEQLKVIGDYNGDGKVDPTDVKYAFDSKKITNHPIMQWAAKNPYFQKQAMGLKPKGIAKRPTTPSSSSNGFTINWMGRNEAIPVGQKRKVGLNYGGETRNNLYTFGGSKILSDFPTDGAYSLLDTRKKALQGGSNIEGKLVDYDADSDKLIVRTTRTYSDLGLESGQLTEIDAKKVQDVDKLPLTIDGQQTTVGAIRNKPIAQNNISTPKMSFAEWRKANPNKPVSDYSKM